MSGQARQAGGQKVSSSSFLFVARLPFHPTAVEGTAKHLQDLLFDSGDGLDLPSWSYLSKFLVKALCSCSDNQSITLVTPPSPSLHKHTFFPILSLFLSEALSSASHRLSTAAHLSTVLSSKPSRPYRIEPSGFESRRDEVRRGEAKLHGAHGTRTTAACGLRRRSPRHHRTPPNLGKTTQSAQCSILHDRISCREASDSSARSPYASVHQLARTNSSSSWPTRRQPTQYGFQYSRQYLLYLELFLTGLRPV